MAHVFLSPFAMPCRPGADEVGIMRTADDDASVTFKVKYWPVGVDEGDATATTAVSSTAPGDPERLIKAIASLESNTQYNYKIIENLNGGGDSELARTGQFWTSSESNDDDVCGMIVGDIHNGNKDTGSASSEELQDVDSVADVLVSRGAQMQYYGGDDVNNVSKAYIVGANATEIRATIETAHANYLGMWERPLSLAAVFRLMGNHEAMGAESYGVQTFDEVDYLIQQWHTEKHKQFFANFSTALNEANSEWAVAADITANEDWVAAPNRPPFENYFAMRHGPVLVIGMDSERYGDAANQDSTADVATMGATQVAKAIADADASDATWKILMLHRTSGGYDRNGSAVNIDYRRGSAAQCGSQRQFAWGASQFYDLLVRRFDAIFTFHDHVNSFGYMKRFPGIPCFQGGSPTAPFAIRAGTAPGVSCKFMNRDRSVWLYEASGRACTIKCVRTVNDDRDATLNSTIFEHNLTKGARFS